MENTPLPLRLFSAKPCFQNYTVIVDENLYSCLPALTHNFLLLKY